jgi:hypothetical protein
VENSFTSDHPKLPGIEAMYFAVRCVMENLIAKNTSVLSAKNESLPVPIKKHAAEAALTNYVLETSTNFISQEKIL